MPMKNALVSIAMPYYNAAASLPMALASLLAQRYDHWECLLIDDGSTQDPRPIVAAFADPRIRVIRLERNGGTGVARQVALEQAKGDYLGMLDADDWYYPDKLARQLAVIEAEPRLTLVSTGMAIVDRGGAMVGVRCRGSAAIPVSVQGPWQQLTALPLAHAPSLLRMDVARQVRYRPELRRSEDTDFLLNLLWGRYYALLPDVAYAYAEYAPTTVDKLGAGYRYRIKMLWAQRHRDPKAAFTQIFTTWSKLQLYRVARQLGRTDWLIQRRSHPPTSTDLIAFTHAKAAVQAIVTAHIGS
jgi:glycosyltransferase involved in cell wall biosynthesis